MTQPNPNNQQNDQPQSDTNTNEAAPPDAHVRRTPWRGWIWSVPLAAMILVAYLVVRPWLLTGPIITIIFPDAGGLGPTGTVVKYKGVQVGSVNTVQLTSDHQHVKVTASINADAASLLRTGTRFWITQPSILSGDLSSLLSGPYIAMRPGSGEKTSHFNGTLQPATTRPHQPGKVIALYAENTGGLHHGSPVLYRGIPAGKILGLAYDPTRDQVRIDAFITPPFDQRLNSHTRFWRIGSLGLSTRGGGLNLEMPPLDQLLRGAVAFGKINTPNAPTPSASTTNARFDSHLYDSARDAHSALVGKSITFAIRLPGSVRGLDPGSPVTLRGIQVGCVRHIDLAYDPERQSMLTSVTIALYPARFGLNRTRPASTRPIAPLQNVLATLVARGLRAQLTSANLLLGTRQISLVMVAKPGTQSLDTAVQPPRIPTVSTADITGIIASINHIADKIDALPLQNIALHVLQLSSRLQKLAASPRIDQSIRHLNQTLANLQKITAETRSRIKPTLQSLRNVADAAESTAKTITSIVGGSLSDQQSVRQLVAELTRTARAVRILANYLQRHPEALLKGRTAQ